MAEEFVKKAVDLDRRFFDFPTGRDLDLDQHIALSAALRNLKTWSDILSLPYAIVLGEAGSGKTTEFRETARKIAVGGEPAFFVPVEALAMDGLLVALGPDAQASLKSWIKGTGIATFFLDSLDEAKLQRLTLDRALRRFAADVGSALTRSRVLISCRASDWNVFADRDALEKTLANLVTPTVPATEDARQALNIFGLAPLTIEQVETFARSLGLTTVDAFMAAISEARAQVFVERPVDVEWMVQYWNKTGNLGSLTELLRSNIQEKLRDENRPPRGLHLSGDRISSGVTQLAGIGALSGRISFLVSGDAEDRINDSQTIVPGGTLRGWSPAEIAELLSLPIFDESTLGQVRLHHRAVQEYLAADWLRRLRAAGLPRRELEGLLFPSTPYLPDPILPAHLRGIAAWLATDDAVIRATLLKVAPDVLLGEGDPSAIPMDERRQILIAYAERFRGRRRLFETVERAALRRFAFDGLAPTINALAIDLELADEVRTTLLAIVAAGKIAACAETALSIALDSKQPLRVRAEAIPASVAAGAPDVKKRLFAITPATDLEQELVSAMVETLFPERMSVDEFVGLLEQAESKRRNLLTGLQYFMEHRLGEVCSQAQRLDLLARFLVLVETNDKLAWLPSTIASVLREALLEVADRSSLPKEVEDSLTYFEGMKRGHHFDPSLDMHAIEELLANRPLSRRTLFWSRVGQKETSGRRITRYHDAVEWWWLFELSPADFEWLADDALSGKDAATQVLAFDSILRAKYSNDDRALRDALIKQLTERSPVLAEHLRRVTSDRGNTSAESQRFSRMMRAIDLRHSKQLASSREALEKILPLIREGKHDGALVHFHSRGRNAGNRWASFDDEMIRKDYGGEIAAAAHEGFRRYWKTAEVPAPAEWKEGGRVPTAMILGLTGLTLDLSGGFDLLAGPPELRRTAVRLAAWELNGFPDWLPALAEREPDETRKIFEPLLKRDFDAPEATRTTEVLGKLLRAPQTLKQILAPFVASRLVGDPPKVIHALDLAFRVVETTKGQDVQPIVKRAAQECRNAATTHSVRAAWFVFWLNQDATSAIDALSAGLAVLDAKDADELVEEVLAQMWEAADATLGQITSRIHENAEAVARLLPIAFKHVPREADVWHEGVYHPARRDHAQTMRDRLVASLASLPPAESVERLGALANQREFAELRDYLVHKAYEQAANHPDCLPWSPEQVMSWSETFVREPKKSAQLYQATYDALDDIRIAQERGNHSLKDLFDPSDEPIEEKPVQVMLARELNAEARGRFIAVLEEELAQENYPDIRVHNPKVNGAIALEVKIAERWSYNALMSALTEQLVAQYLRDPLSRHGILVVASSGPAKRWMADRAPITSFVELVKRLRVEAERVCKESGMDALSVVGIDFH
jgi:hypothetical protein